MANKINLLAQLEASKPVLVLGEGEEYEINDDKNVILKMDQILKDGGSENDIEGFDKMFEALLGKEAVKKMEANHPGITTRVSQMLVLMTGIIAAVRGVSYEEVAESFRTA